MVASPNGDGLQICVLGPIEVRRGAARIDIGGAVARRVLAILVAHRGEAVSRDLICDALWGDTQPATAERTLQSHISRLRSALRPEATIESQAPGYVLHTGSAVVDCVEFERVVHADQAAATERIASLEAALATWRGSAFAEFADEAWAVAEAGRVDETRVHALEMLTEARLDAGAVQQVVGDLERLVMEHPLRERFWNLLVLALYRSGRRPEALRRAAELRRMLRDELGLDPSPAARQLEAQVLMDDPALVGVTLQATQLAAAPPPPPFLRRVSRPFIARIGARATISDAWHASAAGAGNVVVIDGEAGIGKTRLVAEIAQQVTVDNAIVLGGRCDELAGGPYHPVRDAVCTLLEGLPSDLAEQLLLGCGQLTLAVPELAPFNAAYDGAFPPPADDRRAVFEAFVRLVERVATLRPSLLVFDDLHWSDEGTLLLLHHALGQLATSRVCVILTYRTEEHDRGAVLGRFLASLRRAENVAWVHLDGLDEQGTDALVRDLAPEHFSLEAVREIHLLTDGNPFFVGQVVSDRIDVGKVTSDTGDPRVPDGVRQVLRQRLRQFDAGTNEMLAVAAVAGRRFDVRVVAAAMDVDPAEVLKRLDPVLSAGVVVERTEEFEFVHELVRATLIETLSRAHQALLHLRIAQAIERTYADNLEVWLVDLAHHWLAVGSGHDDNRAAAYAVRAAELALARYAFEDAALWARRALDRVGPAPSEARWAAIYTLAAASVALVDDALLDLIEQACSVARDLADPIRMARAAILVRPRDVSPERVAGIVSLLDEVLATLPAADSAERALALAVHAGVVVAAGNFELPIEEIQTRCDDALAMAQRLDEDEVELRVARIITNARSGFPDTRVALRLALRVRELDEQRPFLTYPLRCEALARLGRRNAFAETLDAVRPAVDLFPYLEDTAWFFFIDGLLAYVDGSDDAVEAANHRALETFAAPSLGIAVADRRLRIAWQRGDVDGIEDRLERTRGLEASFPQLTGLRAIVAAERGRPDEARALARTLLADNGAHLPWNGGRPRVLHDLAEIAGLLADTELAAVLHPFLVPYDGEMLCSYLITVDGAAATALGIVEKVLGHDDAAVAHFAAGVALERAMGATPLAAATEVWQQWALGSLIDSKPAAGDGRAARLRRALHS